MFNGKIHYKLPFSIAMLNYQRVNISVPPSILYPHKMVGDISKKIPSKLRDQIPMFVA